MAHMGMSKHRKSGHANSFRNFTGPKVGKRVRRKGTTRKQRQANLGTHENRYDDLASLSKPIDHGQSTDPILHIKLKGRWMDRLRKGTKITHEGKRYKLREDVIFPRSGEVFVQCKLVTKY